MRFAVLLVAVLAFAAYAGAQVTAPEQAVRITSDSFGRVGNVFQARGNVQVQRGDTLVVTADEVDVIPSTGGKGAERIELRGNVRLATTEDSPVTIHKRWVP